ncbi:type VI secretion system secreted protein VgrG [Streptosporangium becharense]|uniref:Type VI secretion system secreted protein VgrG n=1 Tax=Streptosporangium becharense TaxID=1816182 RepID=A0A7W9IMW4_9ACTN|nr:hypothetical protein [Streptosporangium becharense]MBB2910300.1 type VI secretion system secreted protein VgrG [Streptosporangium becharense]MBB5823043.1 type VI secretion system secreted protein VgrG [Streptosporangium becharense]
MPTNRDMPHERERTGAGRAPRRIARPVIGAAALALLASGGIGVASASASAPVPPPSQTPTPTETTGGTPAPAETPAPTGTAGGTPTESPTGTPTETSVPEPVPTVTAVPTAHPLEFSGAVHGEFLAGTDDPCVFVTVFAQTGEATAVEDGSITVRSVDGFEQVYTVDDDTRVEAGRRGNSEVRQGDWVALTATRDGETATASYVYDLSRQSKKNRRGDYWSQHRRGWPGAVKWRPPAACPTPPQTPIPTATPTVTETPTAPPTVTPTVTPTAPPTATATVTTTPAPAPASSGAPAPAPVPNP